VLSQALRKIVPVLEKLQVPYALISGLALAPHNVVRATEDLDFLIGEGPSRMSTLVERLRAKGLHSVSRKGSWGDPLVGVIAVEVPTTSATVVCDLVLPTARWQSDAVRGALIVEVEGFAVRVVQVWDLFLLKLYAGGPQDQLDAADLLRMQNPSERLAWKEAASQHRLTDTYKLCLKLLKEIE